MKICYSSSTVLILIWGMLASAIVMHRLEFKVQIYQEINFYKPGEKTDGNLQSWPPAMVLLLSGTISLLLADMKLGHFKMAKVGAIIMFLGSILTSLTTLITCLSPMAGLALELISGSLVYFGASASLITLFQLGLDQMLEAATSDITMYVSWFLTSIAGGFWFGSAANAITFRCSWLHENEEKLDRGGQNATCELPIISKLDITKGFSLFAVLCSSCILVFLFMINQRSLCKESYSAKTLKTIFKVLKFAAMHKKPLNRSCFTYWEQEKPNRLDVGKSRYGGPFSTDDVENVKTFFKLIIVFIPVWITVFAIHMFGIMEIVIYNDFRGSPKEVAFSPLLNAPCVATILMTFTYNPWWCSFLMTIGHKIVYWLTAHRSEFNNYRRRQGIVTIAINLMNFAFLMYAIVKVDCLISKNFATNTVFIVYTALSACGYFLLCIFTIEFVCAQSPYYMKGFIFGTVFFIIFLSTLAGYGISKYLIDYDKKIEDRYQQHIIRVVQYSVATGMGFVGLILHYILTSWYKPRERDNHLINPYADGTNFEESSTEQEYFGSYQSTLGGPRAIQSHQEIVVSRQEAELPRIQDQ